MAERTQRSNILLAFISLTAVIAVVAEKRLLKNGKRSEIIKGQPKAEEKPVSP